MKRRVLLVSCKGLGKGGVQSVIMSIVRNLSPKFTFDIVLFTRQIGYYENEFKSYGGQVYRIAVDASDSWLARKIHYFFKGSKIYMGMKRILAENGPYDVIHCNNYYESAYCLKAAYEQNIPVRICHIHGVMPRGPFILGKVEDLCVKMIEKYATKRIACSEIAYSSVFGYHSEPSVVVNAYDDSKFDSQKVLCKKNTDLTISQVGYYCENKNQIFTLAVVHEIKKVINNVTLNLVGFDVDGYQAFLEKEVDRLQLTNNVKFLPHDSDVPALFAQSHMALVPSIREGFGIVVVEAQSMGCHVFASDAVPKITDAGGCTYLPLKIGASEWASEMLKWYDANRSITQVYDCSTFTEDRIMQEYEKIYEGKE